MIVVAILVASTACATKAPQDPRCPDGWTFDEDAEGLCDPPEGYAGVLWIELGGSGIYGFARSDTVTCMTADDPTCDEMLTGLTINVYAYADLSTSGGIRQGAPVLGTAMTSEHGLYKLRIDPGDYAVTTLYQPIGASHPLLYPGEAKVISNTVALFPFDIR